MVQTSIKTCKANQNASLHVPRDINAQIVQGYNVSHRKVNFLSIVMVLRKPQKNAMSALIIQLMDQIASWIAKIALLGTTVLIQLDKKK